MAICALHARASQYYATMESPDDCIQPYRIITTAEYIEYQTMKKNLIYPDAVFDPATGAAIFTSVLVFTLTIWWVSWNIGHILAAIKRFF